MTKRTRRNHTPGFISVWFTSEHSSGATRRQGGITKAGNGAVPQIVTLRGERAAVVLSAHDYDALTAARPTLVDALLSGPTWDDELANAVASRAKTPSRDAAF